MTETSITSEVDLDAAGKHTEFLRIPHSVHRSAYGWIATPVISIKNGDGPTIVMMAGNHGDEYEGEIILSNLARTLKPEVILGRVILLPMVNAPAAQAGLRTSPIDDGNLNRSLPGNASGNSIEMIAHYIEQVLLPLADFSVDLHSGRSPLFYPPTLLRGRSHTPKESAVLIRVQEAFDLPYAWVFTSGGGMSSTARTAVGAANRNGVINVMAELGGGGAVTPAILKRTERGLLRVLHTLGMLPAYSPEPPQGARELNAEGMIYAYTSGVFEPLKISEMIF